MVDPNGVSKRSWWLVGLACCVVGSLLTSLHQGWVTLPHVRAQALDHPATYTASRGRTTAQAADITGKVMHLIYDVVTDGRLTLRKEEWDAIATTPSALSPHLLIDNPSLPLSISKFRGVLTDATGQVVQEAWSADTSQNNADYHVPAHQVMVSHAHNGRIDYPVSPWALPVHLNPMLRGLRHTEGGVQQLPDTTVGGEPVSVLRITATGDVYYISKLTQRLVRYEWTYQGHHTVQTLLAYQTLALNQVPAAIFDRPMPTGVTVSNQ